MTTTPPQPVTVLGLGAMGQALARALVDAGYAVTIWNRTPGKAGELTARGAIEASSIETAVTASPVVIACLFDFASVHETLDAMAEQMHGRALINLTTTTPDQARDLAAWAERLATDYLDGGIMAVPEMIGGPGAAILYSGSRQTFDRYRAVLDMWAESTYFGSDAGLASLYDLAMLAGMYAMFAGFAHGAAMVASAGVSATEFASLATPFIAAMTGSFAEFAKVVDSGDYAGSGQQSLEFSDLGKLVEASVDAGIRPDVIDAVQGLIRRQISAGHGNEGFARIYEEIRYGGGADPRDSAVVSAAEPAEQAKREPDAASGRADPLKSVGAGGQS